ncbi:hypothetical protein Tsubulata_008508 [Turnera subulata]|uniref:Uncharacterized protein n=1 Tax=Turnera subulata TaxID=218843 RepID=A0A9Q0JI59_9ROSI|nr:hypothetical protein Tsubulata_008508 [Turnera subulata]
MNVNEEYLSALRTKSFADFFDKAQFLSNDQASFPVCHHKFSEVLLEPCQETIPEILESAILSSVPELKHLVLNYFDLSADASKICTHLLRNIKQIQTEYQFVHQVLDSFNDYPPTELKSIIISELNTFITQSNPFSTPNKDDFKLIRDRYSLVLHLLKSKRRKVARKIKLITCIQKATGISMTAACGLIAVTAIALAAHTLTAFVMGPAILSFPLKRFKKKLLNFKFLRSGNLRKIGRQLDVAAKGTYILNRDFDTMSRLVARLHDEVEHNKAMLQFCLERKEVKLCLQMIRQLKKNDIGFKKQVEELKEHVYLSLVTINRARSLVIDEITTSSLQGFR